MKVDRKTIFVLGAVVVLLLTNSFFVIATKVVSNDIGAGNVFNIKYEDESTIKISVNLPALDLSSIDKNGENFAKLELQNEGFTIIQGEAQLPVIRKMVEIPQGATPEILVNSVSWKYTSLEELGLPGRILPVQPSVVKMSGAQEDFVINDAYYASNAFAPSDIVKIVSIGDIRSRRFALVEVSTIQYNPALGELKIMKTCEFTINFIDSNLIQTSEKITRYTSPSFEEIYKTAYVNYGFYEQNIANNPRDQEGYLIIVYDDFYDEIQPLATWKTGKGFDVTVTTTSNITGGPTKENIHAYIDEAYNTWPTPPTYVLLVGDTPQIPTFTGTETGTCTDLYYVTINTDDYFADIVISRFPAATAEQVTIMVDKTLYYEQGSFPDYTYIKKAAFMASSDNYQVSEGTHNFVIDTYMTPNGYTSDKLYCHTYGATTQQVKDALNNGRSLAIYSGHGGTDYWADGPVFYQSDVNSLTNDGMYPFVASHACLTNQFTVAECFGETWLRAANKGGVAFWGATTYSYWDEDDILERSMFKAWWVDNIEDIGGMTNMALYYLYQNYGGGGMSKYYFEEYNVLGDSSVKIWRNNPSNPPEKPSTPSGPTQGVLNAEYAFTSVTTEPDQEDVYYLFDWDDGTTSNWLGPYAPGVTVTASHTWTNVGDYDVKVVAKDVNGAQSFWSDPHTIAIVANQPPNIPEITGPENIKPALSYLYTITATDPEADTVQLNVDWGDGNSQWYGPYNSGQSTGIKHSWMVKGAYTIKTRAKDSFGNYGEWAELNITVKLGKNTAFTFNSVLQQLLQRFPNAFPILRMLTGL